MLKSVRRNWTFSDSKRRKDKGERINP
jgi:hypothetical protein